jgi:hypothetical protein
VDAWRWIPPSATTVKTDAYEVAVTPGSYALTYVYGFAVADPEQVDRRLRELRAQIESLGGTGARLRVPEASQPPDLAERLQRHGYRVVEEVDALVWELRDADGALRFPEFRPTPGISVREVRTEPDFETFVTLGTTIFQDPAPSPESRRGFLAEFRRKIEQEGHSDRYLALDGTVPIGRAGMEIKGPVVGLWGTGVLSQHRGRGVYGALVRARCEAAAGRGAEVVLVVARAGTSGPILQRHGFRSMGTLRTFEIRW